MLSLLFASLDLIHIADRLQDGDPFQGVAILVIDAVLCRVECDRKDYGTRKPFFSVKHGCHGLKYEVGVHWRTGKLYWIAGGVLACFSDITITRQGASSPTSFLANTLSQTRDTLERLRSFARSKGNTGIFSVARSIGIGSSIQCG